MPLFFLIFLFLAIYAEFSVAVSVAGEIGPGLTLLAMVGTAVVGVWLVRLQGFDVYRKIAETTQKGEAPVEEMLHGFLLLFAGFLLIIPGFISDGLGALLLIPPIRSLIISRGLWKNFARFEARTTATTGGVIIEGEYEKENHKDAPGIGHEKPPRRGK